MRRDSQPIVAGVVTGVVGFSGAFAVVLVGLGAVGATDEQAASGLLVLCVAMALCAIGLSLWTRLPVHVAWSTPGAALLATVGTVDGGWSAAIGAFLVTSVLIVITGFWGRLARCDRGDSDEPGQRHARGRPPPAVRQARAGASGDP